MRWSTGYDRGQVLIDLGLIQLAGGQAIGDFQTLAHLEKLIGPVASTPTVWRSLNEADRLQVARIHQAVCRFRRLWWGMLAAGPEGFLWLRVAGRELTGITVIDLDASVVKVAGDSKENARPTYKGGVGYLPNRNLRQPATTSWSSTPGPVTPPPTPPPTTSPP